MSNPSEKAMEYIKIQLALIDHPKFTDLIDFLTEHKEKPSRATVLGALAFLWLSAGRHYSDGQIRDEHDVIRRIAKISEWPGNPKIWVEGLEHVRFIERNDDGFYLRNWMERHAREWWLKQEDHERVKRLARERAARFRANLKKAREEARFLKEKFGVRYDASSPPLDKRNADLALLTRDAALRNVANEGGMSDETLGVLPPIPVQEFERRPKEVLIAMPTGKELTDNAVREISVANALRDVTSRASRSNRVEESRVEEKKDKAGAELAREANDAPMPAGSASATHQSCINLWDQLHRERYEGEPFGNVPFLAKIIGKRSKQGYDVLETRIRSWWKSTYHKIVERNFAPSDFDRRWSELKNGPILEWERTQSARRPADGEDFRKPHAERDSGFGKPDNE